MSLAAFAQPASSDYERHVGRKLEILRYDHAVFEAANRNQQTKITLTFIIDQNGTAGKVSLSPAISRELEAAVQRTVTRIKFDRPSRAVRVRYTLALGT